MKPESLGGGDVMGWPFWMSSKLKVGEAVRCHDSAGRENSGKGKTTFIIREGLRSRN